MAKKRTPKQKALYVQYRKQYQRVKQAQRRLQKQGYTFADYQIPVAPSKLSSITTASIRKLEKLTPERLRKIGGRVNLETGETLVMPYGLRTKTKPPKAPSLFDEVQFDGESVADRAERRAREAQYEYERQREYDREAQRTFEDTDIRAINAMKADLKRFPNATGARIIEGFLDRIILESGISNCAAMIRNAYASGLEITWSVAYDTQEAITFCVKMSEYVRPYVSEEFYNREVQGLYAAAEEAETWEREH